MTYWLLAAVVVLGVAWRAWRRPPTDLNEDSARRRLEALSQMGKPPQ